VTRIALRIAFEVNEIWQVILAGISRVGGAAPAPKRESTV
jgi:hypothetical protein